MASSTAESRYSGYLNFTLFTFNKIRILIQYLVAKIRMIGLRLGCRCWQTTFSLEIASALDVTTPILSIPIPLNK
ncbi:unnamed protein product [Rhizophagus irregularis]|nr:unnamed protein product [Rhizophagus irregularis]